MIDTRGALWMHRLERAVEKLPKWTTDLPIESRQDDLLDRTPFAEAVATAIAHSSGAQGQVVAIYGAWGSGKSSTKNLVKGWLAERSPEVLVIEFNPWHWRGSTQIRRGLFREVGEQLGLADPAARPRRLQQKWERYAALLGASVSGTPAISALRKAAAALAGLAVVQSVTSAPVLSDFARGLSLLLAVALAVIAASQTVAAYLAAVWRSEARQSSHTVENAKAELGDALRQRSAPVVVVLDDVDRLLPAEIRQLISLIKTDLDLPNVVVLVLADRELLEASLNTFGVAGEEFLDKIVHVPLELPSAAGSAIDSFLRNGIERVLVSCSATSRVNSNRWDSLYVDYLMAYFSTLRRAKRFLNGLEFHASLLLRDGHLEVDPVDLIAIETLRVFEPSVYRGLPSVKDVVTRKIEDGPAFFGSTTAEARSRLDLVMAGVPSRRRRRVESVLERLFPYTRAVWQSRTGALDSPDHWDRDHRVASADFFDRYFQLAFRSDDIPRAAIEELLHDAHDHAATVEHFMKWHHRGLLPRLFEALDSHKESISGDHAEAFSRAVFDVGDLLPPRWAKDFLQMEPAMHAMRVVRWAMKSVAMQDARDNVFVSAVGHTSGLYVPCMRISIELDLLATEPVDATIGAEAVARAQTLWVEAVSRHSETGELLDNVHLGYLVARWSAWSQGAATAWLLHGLSRSSDVLRVLQGLAFRPWRKPEWDVNLPTVTAWVTREQLQAAVGLARSLSLDHEQEQIVQAYERALSRTDADE